MTTERETEAVLSIQEVRRILGVCSPEAILVGGQALAFWADRFDVSRPDALQPAITADVDFIGGSALAQKLAQVLGWKSWIPSLDDVTEQSGKVTHRLADGTVKQVDFLYAVAGLTTADIVRRAIELRVPGVGTLRVMHPVDVLDSRIQNLLLIPQKRNPTGVAQAHLSIAAARAFIEEEIAVRGEKSGKKQIERVFAIASTPGSVRVFLTHDIDPLKAVPLERLGGNSAIRTKRWPQVTAHVNGLRARARRLLEPDQQRPLKAKRVRKTRHPR